VKNERERERERNQVQFKDIQRCREEKTKE
jgi:hypothetical protein